MNPNIGKEDGREIFRYKKSVANVAVADSIEELRIYP
jgi:hypothetical protein